MPQRRRSHTGLHRSERYTRRLLHALLDLYQRLRTPQPLDALLQAILDTAVRCVPGAQCGSLLTLREDGLRFRAVSGYDLEALRPVVFPLSIVDEYLDKARVSQLSHIAAWDERHLAPESLRLLQEHGRLAEIRRTLSCKIYVGGRFYGALNLDNLHAHGPFPQQAETLVRVLAEQAGSLLEQALLLEQLRQTNTQLIEAEKLATLGRFIASIAHEINNPLTAVLGYTDFLSTLPRDAETQAMLAQLRHGAERVQIIVRDLQLFARQQRSGVGRVSLNLIVDQAVMLKRGELVLDQIVTEVRLDRDLPESWGDGGQLSQVVLNLLSNAHHAVRLRPLPRLVALETALVGGERGPQLQLRVSDNGEGMSAAVRARVFEPFFTTRPVGEGTGLGLSICASIVADHGGTIAVESEPGCGAVFTVRLPLRAVPPLAAPAPEPARAPAPEGLRVLLVDDDPLVVDVVLRALGRGNRVDYAADGTAGLQLALGGAYDLVLSDLRMPGLDGLELHDRLLAARPELAARVLFISGDTSSQHASAALAASSRPLLAKPFRPEELYAAIAALGA
jgi:signal transduction histidine kinase/CheY-like chemotaxis protein